MKLSKMQIDALAHIANGNDFKDNPKLYDVYCLTLWSLFKRGYIRDLNGVAGLTPEGEQALTRVTGAVCTQVIDPCASDERPTAYDYGFVDGVRYANTGQMPPKRLRYCDLKPGQWFRCSRSGDDTEPMMMTNEKSAFHEMLSVTLSGKARWYNRLTYVELVKPKLSFE